MKYQKIFRTLNKELFENRLIEPEIRNPEPKSEIKLIGEDGIRGYFLSLGNFKDIEI